METLKNLSDTELIHLLNRDHRGAFTEIYTRYWDKLLAVCINRLGDEQEAEECVQDVFTSLWLRRADVVVKHTLNTYLGAAIKYQVIKRLDLRYLKRTQLAGEVTDESTVDSPELALFEKELMARIETTVQALPEKCRMVYRLSRDEGKSNKEIAAELGISEKTVEGHITRALSDIRNNLSAVAPAIIVSHWIHSFKLVVWLSVC
ncbi:RNA polymerase sigma-70 factor [Parapedobacter pyrenivorans]|nr:RNA polymerase sigma-70 factor [Parapedobacter pyrenivorans]